MRSYWRDIVRRTQCWSWAALNQTQNCSYASSVRRNKDIHAHLTGQLQGLRRWNICLQCGRPGFDPWVGNISWRRTWKPTPVLLPRQFHGWRSLVGYSPWDRKESDMTERLTLHFIQRATEILHMTFVYKFTICTLHKGKDLVYFIHQYIPSLWLNA